MKAANRPVEDVKAELNCARSVIQSEKDGLQRELQQALVDKEETKKQVNKDVMRLQKKVKIFKLMKYRDGYNE